MWHPLTMGDEIQILIDQLHVRKPDAPWVNPWRNRKLRPEFKRLREAGAFAPKPGDRDITEMISDDRDGN